ncbi:hypothetical protein [Luteolibacter soli]|uniref:hypothetical protein n=1 Tax=Luteolibacter soli TaxID=3135280 RepID=UPI00311A4BBA
MWWDSSWHQSAVAFTAMRRDHQVAVVGALVTWNVWESPVGKRAGQFVAGRDEVVEEKWEGKPGFYFVRALTWDSYPRPGFWSVAVGLWVVVLGYVLIWLGMVGWVQWWRGRALVSS